MAKSKNTSSSSAPGADPNTPPFMPDDRSADELASDAWVEAFDSQIQEISSKMENCKIQLQQHFTQDFTDFYKEQQKKPPVAVVTSTLSRFIQDGAEVDGDIQINDTTLKIRDQYMALEDQRQELYNVRNGIYSDPASLSQAVPDQVNQIQGQAQKLAPENARLNQARQDQENLQEREQALREQIGNKNAVLRNLNRILRPSSPEAELSRVKKDLAKADATIASAEEKIKGIKQEMRDIMKPYVAQKVAQAAASASQAQTVSTPAPGVAQPVATPAPAQQAPAQQAPAQQAPAQQAPAQQAPAGPSTQKSILGQSAQDLTTQLDEQNTQLQRIQDRDLARLNTLAPGAAKDSLQGAINDRAADIAANNQLKDRLSQGEHPNLVQLEMAKKSSSYVSADDRGKLQAAADKLNKVDEVDVDDLQADEMDVDDIQVDEVNVDDLQADEMNVDEVDVDDLQVPTPAPQLSRPPPTTLPPLPDEVAAPGVAQPVPVPAPAPQAPAGPSTQKSILGSSAQDLTAQLDQQNAQLQRIQDRDLARLDTLAPGAAKDSLQGAINDRAADIAANNQLKDRLSQGEHPNLVQLEMAKKSSSYVSADDRGKLQAAADKLNKVDEVDVDDLQVDEVNVDDIQVDEVDVDDLQADEMNVDEVDVDDLQVPTPAPQLSRPPPTTLPPLPDEVSPASQLSRPPPTTLPPLPDEAGQAPKLQRSESVRDILRPGTVTANPFKIQDELLKAEKKAAMETATPDAAEGGPGGLKADKGGTKPTVADTTPVAFSASDKDTSIGESAPVRKVGG
ncbi:hypothetical protein WJU23_18895 [Prosthecobacter sp. SYSU 5D2]|uniref:hypothetical protein n=1 Tax=Prosthecobacter sp. SYSU 5D2 TaxID=3134134 RepID=UPI0031FEB776